MILDLFAGPGGWDEGARIAGYSGYLVGIEHDTAACRTAVAAGHPRIQADVATYPLQVFINKVAGLVGSPSCTPFSGAGFGAGRVVTEILFRAMTKLSRGEDAIDWAVAECAKVLREYARTAPKVSKKTDTEQVEWAHEQAATSALVLQPLRWALALSPRWIALEQVPSVLPLWEHMALLLRGLGYRTWTGILSAEEYGVPQTRKRAILVARLDAPVGPPAPTHQAYRSGREFDLADNLFGPALPAPVSMAEALGWGVGDRPSWTVTGGGTDTGGAEVFGNAAARRQLDQVVMRSNYGTSGDPQDWVQTRPATTVCGDARLGAPGHRDREGGERQFGEQSVRVTVQEAGTLQSFPADYPWQGTKSKQYQQVGNAIPPMLAASILRPLIAVASSVQAGEVAA